MAFREVTIFEIREVIRLWLDGHGRRTIARSVGADLKTVRRYVRAAESLGLAQTDGIGKLEDERFFAVLKEVKTPAPSPKRDGRRLYQEQHFIKQKLRSRVLLT